MSKEAYERIRDIGALPSPGDFAQKILRVANDPSTTIANVATVVEGDPATAARLLKLVNSPLAGVSRTIVSISQAVGLLGLQSVKSLAVAFSLVSQFKQGRCAQFDYETYWSESLATAVTARHLAHRLKQFAPDEVFSCGLFCQIGRLAFATVEPGRYAVLLRRMPQEAPASLSDAEREAFGIDHCALAAEMMADWSIPAVYCDAVRHQDSADHGALDEGEDWTRIARMLHFSVTLSHVLVPQVIRRETLTSTTQQANQLGLGPFAFPEVFDSVAEEWRDIGAIFNVRTRRVPPLAEIYTRDVIDD